METFKIAMGFPMLATDAWLFNLAGDYYGQNVRAGAPLVLVYPKNPRTQPAVLPQILTPGIVLNALNRAEQ